MNDTPLGRLQGTLREYRIRSAIFDADLFYDPAWLILLDLMAHHLVEKPVSISSACVAAQVPPTTALRWLRVLEERLLVHRRPDPTDGRRVFVALTATGVRLMENYLAQTAT